MLPLGQSQETETPAKEPSGHELEGPFILLRTGEITPSLPWPDPPLPLSTEGALAWSHGATSRAQEE